jgi:hypothetical protein
MLTGRTLACFDNASSYYTDQYTLLHRVSLQRYFDINGQLFFFRKKVYLPKIQTATLAVH